jgi:hypothetical protein
MPEGIESVPFEQLAAHATRLKAQRRPIDGRETVVVELSFDRSKDSGTKWDAEIHFDPAVNYLVRKVIYTGSWSSGNLRREDEVVHFKECAPGVFFPERTAGRSGPEGKFDFNHTTKFSDIRINQPLPKDIFQIRYPNGVYLSDHIRGVGYHVNTEGRRISPETPLEGRSVPPPPVGVAANSAGTETQTEPRSATRWILPASLSILLFTGVVALVRRWQKRTRES